MTIWFTQYKKYGNALHPDCCFFKCGSVEFPHSNLPAFSVSSYHSHLNGFRYTVALHGDLAGSLLLCCDLPFIAYCGDLLI